MRRSLRHYWKSHLAVAAGAAVASAVLTGALVVGDSVRGSLRDLALSRLGQIEYAALAGGFVRQDLAAEMGAELGGGTAIVPLVVTRGSAVHATTEARASRVQILGIEDGFGSLFDREIDLGRLPGQIHPSALIAKALADALGAAVGDEILLSFERPSEVPRETLVGREDAGEMVEVLRLTVRDVLPARGMGGFRLRPEQSAPLNLFVELGRLQRAFFGREDADRVNALLVATGGGEPDVVRIEEALANRVETEDLGTVVHKEDETWTVGSRGFVLSSALATATLDYAEQTGAAAQPVLAYLANSIDAGDRSVPYSTVVGIDPPESTVESLGALTLVDGSPAPRLEDGEVLLNAWAADDLGATPGDRVTLTYYELGSRDSLTEKTVELTLRGVVALSGVAVDPHLVPEFPGMHDAEDITAWKPPFPVDLGKIRDRDETYWDLYRAAPKALVSLATARRLWSSRFGDTTSIRLGAPSDPPAVDFGERLALELPGAIGLDAGGLAVLPLRRESLERAKGATDFAGLFGALSMFLIASAALLVGLLFRLGIERRGREVGLLRAVGYGAGAVRRRFLAEGFLVAGVGAAGGLAGAVAYAGAMLVGLRTWWLPAIGTPVLFLHVEPATLATGWVAALVIVALTIWLALRKLGKVATPRLLAGAVSAAGGDTPGARSRWTAILAGTAALGLVVLGLATGTVLSVGVALGVGAALLIAGIAVFAARCGAAGAGGAEERLGGAPVLGHLQMGARNSGRNRGRSILSVGLIASAVFTLVVAGANRREGEVDVEDRGSGAGGFTLLAEADVPLQIDLNDPGRRAELGFDDETWPAGETAMFPLRLLPGEDASCLNLYRPEKPRLLGVTPELAERGGFDFQAVADLDGDPVDNPWSLLEREIEPGVIPAIGDANSVMWILHLGLGQDLVVEDELGREVRLRFVGLLRKSLFGSEVLISEERFLEHFPSQTGYGYFLIDTPDAGRDAVATGLEKILAPFGFDVTPSAERLAAFQAVENTYIATFQTLGGLGLVLGTLGLGIVLLRNVLERRGELATLRAFGYRRRLLAQLVLAENGYLLLAGLVVGTVAGLAAAAPNLVSAAHRFPWSTVVLTLVLVLVAGMLASLLAVRGTLRTPLLPALKEE